MTDLVTTMLLAVLGLLGVEVNPGQLGTDTYWIRYGEGANQRCYYLHPSRSKEAPSPNRWMNVSEHISISWAFFSTAGSVAPASAVDAPFCAALKGADTSLVANTQRPVVVPVVPVTPAPVIGIVPGQTMTTPAGVWSFGTVMGSGGNALLLNGTQAGGGYGIKLFVIGGKVYTFTAMNQWYVWNNGWSVTTAPQ